MESWKQYQKKNKSTKRTGRMTLIVVSLVVCMLLLVGMRYVFQMLRGPERLPLVAGFEQAKWNTKYQFNLFVNPNWMLGYDQTTNELKYYRLAEDPSIDSLDLLSKQNKLNVDGYLIVDDGLGSPEDLGNALWRELWSQEISTNLSRWQYLRMWWNLRGGVDVREIEGMYLPETAVLEESLKIMVLNGTSVSGLATEASGWVENIGAKVIDVGNASSQIDRTTIEVFAEEKNYRTIQRMEEVFSTKANFIPSSEPKRYDVLITVGNNFLR